MESEEGNLLKLAVDAARCIASLSEISNAVEKSLAKEFGEKLEETARHAVENDCHLVAMSSLAVDHMNLPPTD